MNVIRKFYGTGFGSLHTSQKNEPAPTPGPPGPPFLLNSADSGLWVNPVSGKIELDGSGGLNPLLQNTAINLGGFIYNLLNGLNRQFSIDLGPGHYFFGDIDAGGNGSALEIFDGANTIVLGILSAGAQMQMDLNTFSWQAINGQHILLDEFNSKYTIGDINVIANGTQLIVDDGGSKVDIITGAAGNLLLDLDNAAQNYQIGDISGSGGGSNFDIADLNKSFTFFTLTNTSLLFNESTGRYRLGDVGNSANGHLLDINDATGIIDLGDNVGILLRLDNSAGPGAMTYFTAVGSRGIDINGPNALFSMGDLDANANGSYIEVDDGNQTFRFFSNVTNDMFLNLDVMNGAYQIGDVSGFGNNTFIDINDGSQQINLQSANGVGINGTPTLSPFAVAGLQAFANNAAAVVGGLAVGDFYRISVAGTSAVAVVQ